MKNAAGILALCITCTAVFAAARAASADAPGERILRYESTMAVARDSSATVTERITFTIEGRAVRHGIIRFFPVDYRTPTGESYRTGFELLSVRFDGETIPHTIARESGHAVIRIGDPAVLAPRGEHVYELVFRVTGHILFLEDRDGIYWNVTGNDWEFPIDYACFTLELPEGGEDSIIATNAYTGSAGEAGADFSGDGRLFFETTRPLREKEGFTVAVDWEKGVVEPPAPSALARFAAFLAGDRLAAALLLPLLVLLYFLPMWYFLGRDPAPGTVCPIFDPPDGVEPGLMALVRAMKVVPECLTSNLVQLAVLGHVAFGFDAKGAVLVTRTPQPPKASGAPIPLLWKNLFPDDAQPFVSFSPKNAHEARLAKAYRIMAGQYKRYEDMSWALNEPGTKDKKLYRRNHVVNWVGFALFPVLLYFLSGHYPVGKPPAPTEWSDFLSGLVPFFLFFLFMNCVLLRPGLRRLGSVLKPQYGVAGKLFNLVLGAVFVLLGIEGTLDLLHADAYLTLSLGVSWGLFHCFAGRLMPAHTEKGAELLRQIDGFAMYVTAEKEFLARVNAPEDTVERYEAILPYAIALGAADKWNARFGPILERYRSSWSGVAVAETLIAVAGIEKTVEETDRFVRSGAGRSVISFLGEAVWSGVSGTDGGSSGGGSGGGGGKGW